MRVVAVAAVVVVNRWPPRTLLNRFLFFGGAGNNLDTCEGLYISGIHSTLNSLMSKYYHGKFSTRRKSLIKAN